MPIGGAGLMPRDRASCAGRRCWRCRRGVSEELFFRLFLPLLVALATGRRWRRVRGRVGGCSRRCTGIRGGRDAGDRVGRGAVGGGLSASGQLWLAMVAARGDQPQRAGGAAVWVDWGRCEPSTALRADACRKHRPRLTARSVRFDAQADHRTIAVAFRQSRSAHAIAASSLVARRGAGASAAAPAQTARRRGAVALHLRGGDGADARRRAAADGDHAAARARPGRCRSCSSARPMACRTRRCPTTSRRATRRWSTTAISSSSSRCAGGSSRTACSRCRPRSTRTIPRRSDEATDAYDTIGWLVKNVAAQQRQGRDVGRLLSRLRRGDRAGQAASGAEGGEPAGGVDRLLAVGRPPPQRRAAADLCDRLAVVAPARQDENKDVRLSDRSTPTTSSWSRARPRRSIATISRARCRCSRRCSTIPTTTLSIRGSAGPTRSGKTTVPTLNVAGFWDQEDPWGSWQIYARQKRNDPERSGADGRGAVEPWRLAGQGRHARRASRSGSASGEQFKDEIQAPFFRYWLHGKGARPDFGAKMFQIGIVRLEDLRGLAARGRDADRPVPARRWHRCRSPRRRRARRAATMSPTPPTRCRSARGRSRRPIPRPSGGSGKRTTSASSITGPTC